ncbi:MAG: hypothetical protein KDK24_17510 [Pseudooceanicola sp.]|nr:hypothetical protein [Pseudooceanicola sp.]
MQADLILTLGLLLAALAIPAGVAAWADRRPPRAAMLTLLIAGGMVVYAERTKPGGYRLADVPVAIYAVIGSIIR